jgi:hypothetical protein
VLGVLKATLNTVHEEVQVLLSVLLLTGVGGVVTILLETEAVIVGVVGMAGRKLKVGNQVLELVEHIVINLAAFTASLDVGLLAVDNTE